MEAIAARPRRQSNITRLSQRRATRDDPSAGTTPEVVEEPPRQGARRSTTVVERSAATASSPAPRLVTHSSASHIQRGSTGRGGRVYWRRHVEAATTVQKVYRGNRGRCVAKACKPRRLHTFAKQAFDSWQSHTCILAQTKAAEQNSGYDYDWYADMVADDIGGGMDPRVTWQPTPPPGWASSGMAPGSESIP